MIPTRITTRCLRYSMAMFFAVCVASTAAHAQSASATLQGTVADEQGAILPGVSVTIRNVDTGFTRPIVSDPRGWYHAAALPPGRYELLAELSGFATERRAGLTLTVGQDATVNLTLKIAAVAESISVVASAPLVETSDNTIGTTITRGQLDNLPIVGRDFSSLAQTAPGIAGVGGGGVSSGGQRDRANSFLVDGVSNDQVNNATTRGGFSLETVREFVVLANQFSAEYGQASGAIVSVVTRSGTNKLEGRGFLFDRDDHLDSQDPFSAAQGSGKAPFSMKRFGGFLGGPIVRDRLHYFGSYEGLRQSETSVVTSKLVPVDQREFPNDEKQHLYFVKGDVRINDANSIWARYRLDSSKEFGSGIGGLNTWERGLDNVARNQDVALSHTAVVSARTLQEFRFQFGQQVSDNLPYLPLGTPEVNRPSGNFGKAYNQPQGRTENHYQFIENLSYSRAEHDFKVGVAADIVRVPAYFYNNVDGTYRFTTDLPFDAANAATYPVQFTQNIGSPFTHRDTDLYNVFFQDSWRVRRNLTLNVGVRYDVESAYKKALGIDDDKNNVVPRLGFVWDPFGDGHTAVRGGYGWYVDQVFLNLTANLQQARNFTGVTILNPGYPDPYSRGSAGTQPPSTVVVDPNVQTPQTRQASIGVKREVRPGLALSADFVNSRGYHLYNAPDVNSADPITGLRPDPNFLRITRYETTGNSWYRGLLVGLEQRSGHGPSYGVSYTLSRLLRDVEDFQSRGQDPLDRNAETARGDNNRTHQFVANLTWALPRAFQVGAVLQVRSGLPWTVTTGLDNNGDTVFNERPDLVTPDGDPRDASTYAGGFTGRVGSLGRNSATGPAYLDLQARGSKVIKLPRGKVEVFIEAFNLTNRTNLGKPVGNIRSAQFGTSTTLAGPPRQVQLGLRVDF